MAPSEKLFETARDSRAHRLALSADEADMIKTAIGCYPYPAHSQPTPAKATRSHVMDASSGLCKVCGRHEVTIMMSGGMLGDECPGPGPNHKEPRPAHGIVYQPQTDARYPTISDLWVSGRT